MATVIDVIWSRSLRSIKHEGEGGIKVLAKFPVDSIVKEEIMLPHPFV